MIRFIPEEPPRKRLIDVDLGDNIRFIQGKINKRTFLIRYPADSDDPLDDMVMVCLGKL